MGLRFGPYELLQKLGTGATAEVHLATGPNKAGATLFALKILLPHLSERADLRDQLLREARLASFIHHPSVAAVLDVGEAEERAYLAMEYVRGRPLSALLRALREQGGGEGLSVEESCFIVREAALGLHEAHEAADARRRPLGLVHRDVSPQNVMVREDGRIKVVDFGLAKVTSSEEAIAFTVGGPGIKGKLPYLAPEQVRNEPLDRRADVFAACALLFELLCGRRLYPGQTEAELIQQALSLPLPDPLQLAPGLPPDLAQVVTQGLERDLQRRTASAALLAEALRPFTADTAKEKLAWRMERSFDPMPRTVDEARMAALAQRTSGQAMGAIRPISRGRTGPDARPAAPGVLERTTLAAAFPSEPALRTDPASTDPSATGPHVVQPSIVTITSREVALPSVVTITSREVELPTVAEIPPEYRPSIPNLPLIQAEVTGPVSDAARLHALEDPTIAVPDTRIDPPLRADPDPDPDPTHINPAAADPSPTAVRPVDPAPTHVHPVEPEEPDERDEPDEEPRSGLEPYPSGESESPSFTPTRPPPAPRRSAGLGFRFPELSTQQTVIALAAVAALGGLGVGVLLKDLTAEEERPVRRPGGIAPRPAAFADRPRPPPRGAESAKGQVIILAEPMAVVTEDGRELGTTPYVGEHSPGVHQFVLRAAEGAGSARLEITVHANEQVTRRVTLR